MAKDEYGLADAHLLRSFVLVEVEGEPKVRMLRLSSGRDGDGHVQNWLLAKEHLLLLAKELQRVAATMPGSH